MIGKALLLGVAIICGAGFLGGSPARAQTFDPPNLHINGPGGFSQTAGGTDWVTLPTFNGTFNVEDVSNKTETITPWHLILAVPNFTGTLADTVTNVAGTSTSISPFLAGTLLSGQNAYDVLGVPGSGLPNSMSFTNFAIADQAVDGIPTPSSYGLYDFTVTPAALALLPQVIDNVTIGGTVPAGTIIFAWGTDLNGVTYSTSFTNAGVTSLSAPTPEPSTMVIAGLGGLGMLVIGLRSRRNRANS
jgi:hypothetical protein